MYHYHIDEHKFFIIHWNWIRFN